MLKTAAGQMLDVEVSLKRNGFDEQDSIKISHYKTAHYTIIGPMQLGAILAGAEGELLEKIEEFGKNLGIAFQIQDDILGVFGDEKTLGKSVTSDVEEGKNTLLISHALKHADTKQKAFLEMHYGKGELTEENFAKLKQILETTGALDYSRQKAVKYVSLAKQVIPELTGNKQHVQLLSELADFLINRQV
jgi:geranylgeranyl diphosphate synthase type I